MGIIVRGRIKFVKCFVFPQKWSIFVGKKDMKKETLAAIVLLALTATKSAAQHTSALYQQMVENTQKVMIVDSVVVSFDEFLQTIRLGSEAGRLSSYDQFFHVDEQPEGTVYVNERESRCYYAIPDDNGAFNIYSLDKVGDAWGQPQALAGVNDDGLFTDMNYPFLLSDGMTLYFAAKGNESLGGYDIFATRFDAETGRYYRAENIGMPFNSEANDYMYAIDEMNRIGWFVSDRNQPEGMVCVYIFEPSSTRQTYADDDCSDEQLRRYANIASISDTWTDGREEALERIKNIGTKGNSAAHAYRLVINDNKTASQASDLRTTGGRELFNRWQRLKKEEAELEAELDKSRAYYSRALSIEKRTLKPDIFKKERHQEQLIKDIAAIEKEIRQQEN